MVTDLRDRLRQAAGWRPGAYLKSSALLTAWMVLRAVAQAATVLLLARSMGADAYGAFIAAVAIAAFISPLAGMGVAGILLRNGSMDPEHLSTYLRNAMRIWLPSTACTVLTGFMLAALLLPSTIPWLAALFALLVEVAVGSLSEISARYAQAQQRMSRFGALTTGPVVLRLLGFAAMIAFVEDPGAAVALWVHGGTGLLFILIAWPRSGRATDAGEPRHPMRLGSGAPFAIAALAIRVQAEFNKPIMARVDFTLSGNFSVAQRAVDIVALPLAALQESLWPRLFAATEPEMKLRSASYLLLSLAVVCGIAIWWLAQWLPLLLGVTFAPAVDVARMLAWLPILQTMRGFLNFFLIHDGRMRLLGWTYVIGAFASVGAVLALVPGNGMRGAAMAAYLSEAAMLTMLVLGRRFGGRA
jgi:O-antigen/teichoic acid export membrane protein